MLRRAFILSVMGALFWLSGCAGITPATDLGDHYGPCADWMPYYYCGK